MSTLGETLGGVNIDLNQPNEVAPIETPIEQETVIVNPGDVITVTTTEEEQPTTDYGFNKPDETPIETTEPKPAEWIEAIKQEIEEEAQQKAAEKAEEIKQENQQDLDDELEIIKKQPHLMRELAISLRDDLAKLKLEQSNWLAQKKIYDEKLEELYKEKALSKWDDDRIVVPKDARIMWTSIVKHKEHPENQALQMRALERIMEYAADIQPNIDVKKLLAVAFEGDNLEKPTPLETQNIVEPVKNKKEQFNNLGMSQVNFNRPRAY